MKKSYLPYRRALLSVGSVLVAGSAFLASTHAQTILIDEDFESYGNVASMEPPWSAVGGTYSLPGSAQSAFGPLGDDQGVRIQNTNSSATPRLERNFTIPVADENLSLSVQFDYKFDNNTGNPSLVLFDDTTVGININFNRAGASNQLSILEGSTWNDTGVVLSADTWYRFTLTIDSPSQTAVDSFSLTYQPFGDSIVSLGTFGFQNNVMDLDSIRFSYGTNTSSTGGDYSIDNVLIQSIPEPTSALLLGLGVMGLAMLRLRKGSRS